MPRFHHEGYFPGPTVNQNRRPPNTSGYRKDTTKSNNKFNPRYNSYGTNSSKSMMNRSGPKQYQNGGHNYDTTPVKDPNGKPPYEQANNGNYNSLARRDVVYMNPDGSSPMPPPPSNSSYSSPYMYVPYDGNVEQPPPMYMLPSPGSNFDTSDADTDT